MADQPQSTTWGSDLPRPTSSDDDIFGIVFDRAPMAVVLVDDEGRRIDANQLAHTLLGYQRGELSGSAGDCLVASEEASDGSPGLRQLTLRRHGGESIAVNARSVPLTVSGKSLTALFLEDPPDQPEGRARLDEPGYQALIEHLPVVTYRYETGAGRPSRRSYTSPQIEPLLGITPEEWARDPTLWNQMIHPDDRERVFAEDARTDATGEPFQCDYRIVTRDGQVVWLRDRARCLVTSADGLQIWEGIVLDITGEKRTQEAHRQAEARFRALFQNASDIITVSERDGARTFVSPSVERVLGYTAEEWLAGRSESNVSTEDHEQFDDLRRQAEAYPGVPVRGEVRARHKSGSWRWLEITITSFLDDPEIAGVVSQARDVTERKQAEVALVAMEGRARAFLEQVPMLVYVQPVDEPHRTAYVNPRSNALFGLDQETWTATWPERIHPDDREAIERELKRTDETGETFLMEYRERDAAGRYLWVRDEAVLVRGEGAQDSYWIGAKFDVSDRREAEEALRASEALYRSLVEDSPAATYVDSADRLGAPVYASPRIATLLGYEPREWQADPNLWASRLHPDDRDRV